MSYNEKHENWKFYYRIIKYKSIKKYVNLKKIT